MTAYKGPYYGATFDVWRPLPWHKWIKRLRGYRWEKWADALGEWELIYGTNERVAKDYLNEEFGDDVGRSFESIRR